MAAGAGVAAKAGYYPALDGLRAVAVLMVFCQHYGGGKWWGFAWGWTGVDVFLVLSGFLITGILYDSQHREHRFRDFYARRTLRIFPLYYAVWVGVLVLWPVAQWQWNWRWGLWPAYLGNYARFVFLHQPGDPYRFHSIAFGARVNRWFGAPMRLYVGPFWSLCVEEQFYLLWPWVVYRVGRREVLLRICAAAVVLVPMLRWVLVYSVPQRYLAMELLYRCLPTRVDALLLGGLMALLLRGPEQAWLRRVRWPLVLGGAGALAGLYWLSVTRMGLPYVGSATNWVAVLGFSAIDVAAAGVILECVHPGSWVGGVLSWGPLRALGVVSYGFYVYHDLLHDFWALAAHRLAPGHVWAATGGLALVGAGVIATVSYRVLERPMLGLKRHFAGQVHRAPAD